MGQNTTQSRLAQVGVSRLKQTLAVVLNLRPGDGFPLFILLLHSFLKGSARVLLETPANSLFLSRFAIDRLPLVYIATAIVCTVIGLLYARLESRLSVRTLLLGTLGFLSIVTLVFCLCLSRTKSPPVIFGIMIWKDVHWTLMNIEFWALAGLLLDVRQGKRLFGMIALGEIVAGTAGGFSVPLLMKGGGTFFLLLLSAGVTIANVLLLMDTLRRFGGHAATSHEETPAERKPWLTLFKDHYLLLFFGVSMLSLFGEYFIDFLFYDHVEMAFHSEEKLAAFFGIFYGVLGVGQFVSSAWISGRCLTRYGLSFGLLALPVAMLATTGVASVGGVLGLAVAVLFGAILAAKFFDEIIRHTIEMPAYRILYQPLPPQQRLRVQAVRESIIEPLSLGLVGVLLWIVQSVLVLKTINLLYLTFAVAAVWVALCVKLRREYTVRLTRALTARRLGGGNLSLEDESSISVLEQGFKNGRAGQVIYCLDMLDEAQHSSLESNLLKLLEHPDVMVRAHVVYKIERRVVRHALGRIQDLLPSEKSVPVRAAMLRALCALGEAGVLDQVIPFLKDPEPAICRGALVGLLRYCGIDGVLEGGSHLNALIASPQARDRQLAAHVLGDIGIVSFYRPLLALLKDEDEQVRITAIDAAKKLRAAGMVKPLLEALRTPGLRAAASAALAEIGDAAIPALEEAFADPGPPREVLKAIALTGGRIGTEKAAAFLQKHAAHPDEAVRTQVLSALVRCRENISTLKVPEAERMIAREVSQAAWALAVWMDIEADSAQRELSGALLEEISAHKQRVFLLLSLIHPPAVIRKARLDLQISQGEKKAHALEVLDNLLSAGQKKLVFPLIDTLSNHERGKQLHVVFGQQHVSPQARLRELLENTSGRVNGWTTACALYVAGKSGAPEWSAMAVAGISDPDPVVRETALWALRRVDLAAFRRESVSARHDGRPDSTRLFLELLNLEPAHAPNH